MSSEPPARAPDAGGAAAGGDGWSPARTEAFLAERRALVEPALRDAVPPLTAAPERLHAAMHHTLFAPAKRLRPVLLLAAAEAVGVENLEPLLPAAAAMELIHTYSLIHDDLPCMDDDQLRRGRPSCHAVYGEALALLAGDALLTHAFGLLARLDLPGARLASLLDELAGAAGSHGMIGGQVDDLAVEGTSISLDTLQAIHRRKTGALIRAAVRVGATLGEATEADLAALTRYGDAFGLAFQIVDDILDVVGDPASMGKTAGRDAERGKATYPAVVGLAEARRLAREAAAAASEALMPLGAPAEPLHGLARYVLARHR